ncbi:hypothetical protein NA56DRAFT_708855 [Hyaloscypha hepaticicola]|uniref:Serine hydrolase domain-containing protein n=1 Tax=Hyaloscypha hepaticicola TaxID=2082293 RepID=A0A2J6PQJ8_9HELO|nr:hypothetical protein NA56DRAFT_708855 [Hyaloscypha hepaticicola]
MSKSKILCLHGAYTSGEIFRLQLGQLVTRLEKEQNLELHFLDGLVETECQEDMRSMFRGPYYSWCSMLSDNKLVDYESAKQALDFVLDIIVEDGPFDGIMGFSQGAALALALLLRYATDHPLDPAYTICKFAIFFSCVGINEEQNQWDNGNLLSIPSLHVFDKNDSMVSNSLGLER